MMTSFWQECLWKTRTKCCSTVAHVRLFLCFIHRSKFKGISLRISRGEGANGLERCCCITGGMRMRIRWLGLTIRYTHQRPWWWWWKSVDILQMKNRRRISKKKETRKCLNKIKKQIAILYKTLAKSYYNRVRFTLPKANSSKSIANISTDLYSQRN